MLAPRLVTMSRRSKWLVSVNS